MYKPKYWMFEGQTGGEVGCPACDENVKWVIVVKKD